MLNPPQDLHVPDILRLCGFKLIKKYVRRFTDTEGNTSFKANADMDLAIDALLQARNLDRVILLTGDGDFNPPGYSPAKHGLQGGGDRVQQRQSRTQGSGRLFSLRLLDP